MMDGNRIYENMKRLIAVPSISGTSDEVKAAYQLEKMLREIPYFQQNMQNVMLIPIKDDPFDRYLVAAYLECAPEKPDTVVLSGHYDVVDIEEFGKLKDIAYDVESISKRINELYLNDECRKDYESDDWYFGRGTADMKFGHALCLELLRHYSEEGGINGNLLYVAVCGEETNSEGMLAAIPFFNDFAEQHGLLYKAFLLTEGFMVDGQEDGVKYIQYGGSGKLMPLFFCVGAATHGEEPLKGLDANLLAAAVYQEMALNPKFCQQNHGITTAPPAGLKLQDMKTTYSLSTSLYAATYYNIATIQMQPEATMQELIGVAEKAFKNTVDLMRLRAEKYAALSGSMPEYYKASPCVKTFREIMRAVEKSFRGDLQAYLKDYADELSKENPELQDICIKLVKRLCELYEDKRPMIIVSILPPYYPDVNVDREDPATIELLGYVDEIIAYAARRYGETIKTSEYYGISDLCYTWLADGLNFDKLFENLVGINTGYQFPAEALKKFKVPAIVLGSYGKDMHKYTERLCKRYNFDVLPDLYTKLIGKILK